jgi:hypothetical protein
MSALAKRLQAELRERIARLSPTERLELALRLGQRDVQLYAQARCADRETALKVLRAAHRHGRRPSRSLDPDPT